MARQRFGKTEHELLCETGARIARQLRILPEQLRYATYVFHNGRRWTKLERWERLSGDTWIAVNNDEWETAHSFP